MKPRLRSALFVTVSLAGALACQRDARDSAFQSADGAVAAPAGSFAMERSAVVSSKVAPAVSETADTTATGPAIADSAPKTPSMIIRNGSASVQVDSLERAIAAVQQLAAAYGGFVGNTSLSAGEYQVRSATLELKIPVARFDAALNGLAPIGKVESVSTTAEDVGEEFVDVTARAANAKRLENRLVDLLATRTGKLEDVLAVERELARVREEIERYEGRLRFLKTRVAMSTLTITVHERAPLVSATPGQNVILEAFKNAWRNFVGFVAGGISLLGIIIPLGALVVAAFIAWRRWRGRGAPRAPKS
jgi:hypothetical protein